MVKVNLLPPKERTKKQVIRENLVAILLAIIAIFIIAGFSFFLFIFDGNLNEQLQDANDKITQQKEKNDKYKDVEKAISSLNENIERIDALRKKYPEWSSVLKDMTARIPTTIVLEEVSVAASTTSASSQSKDKIEPIILTFKGLAADQYEIARLKESLSGSQYYDYVDFESSVWKQEKNRHELTLKVKVKV